MSDKTVPDVATIVDVLANNAKEAMGCDSDLVSILTTHLLTTAPKKTAVDDAARDIEALAGKRASQSDTDA